MDSFKLKNRALAILLCLVTVGGIAFGVFFSGSDSVEASTSLPGIMELKSSGKEYTILEIVPDTSQAAFAWYVGGSEPVNSNKLAVAYSGDIDGYVSSYSNTVATLQSQNYLISESSTDGILQYVGDVKAISNTSVEGGFVNNEWFHRYVLDWTEDEAMAKITVLTVAPENVTTGHIDMADMVVLSGGYYYPNTATSPIVYNTSADKNLKNDVTDAILTRISAAGSSGSLGMPLILDRSAYNTEGSSSLNSNRLFHEILKDDPRNVASGVYGSVFYFSAVSTSDEVGNAVLLSDGSRLGLSAGTTTGFLVTPQFNSAFASSSTGNFSDVLASIKAENVSRGGVDLLSEEITMARVIRYLVGGNDLESATTVTTKNSVTVLSIQPGDSGNVATFDSSIHSSFGLSAPSQTAKVSLPTNFAVSATADQVSWEDLELWTGVSRRNITVVEQTVNEFVLSSDVLNGTYDLIYIGNDISGSNYGVYQETSHFVTSSQLLADPVGYSYFAPFGTDFVTPATSYTALSNDITVAKYQELADFVSAGRPVVLAPYLCAGLNYRTEVTAPASASVDSSSNMYKFLSSVSGRSNVMRQDMLLVGPDGIAGTSDDTNMIATCVSAVNTPTPTIELMTLSSNSTVVTYNGLAQNVLEYVFQITNDTVSNASGITYSLAVDLDMDADGLYETDATRFTDVSLEQLQTSLSGDLVLDSSMNPIRETDARFDNVKQNQYYRLTVVLPDWIDGMIPWLIKATAYGSEGGVATLSATTWTATSEPISVNMLQIMPDSNMYSTLSLQTNANFNNCISSSVVTEYMNLAITSIDTTTFNNGGYSLSHYDVVLLGFGSDSYVLDNIGQSVVESYISSGGNVMFSYGALGNNDAAFPLTTNFSSGFNTDSFTSYPFTLEESHLTGVSAYRSDSTTDNMGDVYYINLNPQTDYEDNACLILTNLVLSAASRDTDVPETEGGNSGGSTGSDGALGSATLDASSSASMSNSLEFNQYTILSTVLNSSSSQVPLYFTVSEDYSQFLFGLAVNGNDLAGQLTYSLNSNDSGYGDMTDVNSSYYFGSDVVTLQSGDSLSSMRFVTYLIPTCTPYIQADAVNTFELYIAVPNDNDGYTKVGSFNFQLIVNSNDSGNLIQGNDFFVYSHSEGSYVVDNNDGIYYYDITTNTYKIYVIPTPRYQYWAGGNSYLEHGNGNYYYNESTESYELIITPTLYTFEVSVQGIDNLDWLLPQG